MGAFTLIELLVVIAIVAILAGITLPALRSVHQSARTATCYNNLRQLGLATQMYWDDHEGRTFRYRGGSTNGGDLYWFGWLERGLEGNRRFDLLQGALAPYLKGKGVEVCPAMDYGMRQFKQKARGISYGYGYNTTFSSTSGSKGIRVQDFHHPSGTVVFADAAQVNIFQAPASPTNPMLEEFYYINHHEPTVHFRHRGLSMALFLDTHVGKEKMQPETLDQRMPTQRVGRLPDAMVLGN